MFVHYYWSTNFKLKSWSAAISLLSKGLQQFIKQIHFLGEKNANCAYLAYVIIRFLYGSKVIDRDLFVQSLKNQLCQLHLQWKIPFLQFSVRKVLLLSQVVRINRPLPIQAQGPGRKPFGQMKLFLHNQYKDYFQMECAAYHLYASYPSLCVKSNIDALGILWVETFGL